MEIAHETTKKEIKKKPNCPVFTPMRSSSTNLYKTRTCLECWELQEQFDYARKTNVGQNAP
jgi:hypothetical protein